MKDKNLDRIDKALISTRKRLIKCVENGQPANGYHRDTSENRGECGDGCCRGERAYFYAGGLSIMDDDQNTCYECGIPIPTDDHFCDTECRSAYRKRAQRKHAKKAVDPIQFETGLQTKWRKKKGLPRRIDPNK